MKRSEQMNKIRQELQKYKEWLLYDAKTIGYKANTDDVDGVDFSVGYVQ